MLGEDFVESAPVLEHFARFDFQVGDLAITHLAPGLVDHDFRIRQSKPLALRAGRQNQGGATGGNTHAIGGDRAFQELHRVVNRQRGGH